MDKNECDIEKGAGTVLERLERVNGCLDKVSSELLTITTLIKNGSLIIEDGKMHNVAKDIEVISVYERDDVSVLRATLKKGSINPEHNHIGVVEYIICLNLEGKVEMVTPSGSRFCTYNNEVFIPASEPHTTVAVEDTDVICVCVPKEKDYDSVLTTIKNEGI